MSTTSAIGNTTSSTSSTSKSSTSSSSELGMNDFLTLLSAQLQNQDPNNPLDANAFVSELAQLTSVSSLQSMQTSLTSLSDTMRSSQAMSGASLVGHQILTNADSSYYTAGGTLSGAVTVPEGARSVTVSISDSSGQVVRQMSLDTTAGSQTFSWDGVTSSGTSAPSGTYKISITANVAGTTESLQPMLIGTVGSVSIDSNGGVSLNTSELGTVALSDVQQIA